MTRRHKLSAILLIAAVFGAGVLSITHTHVHAEQDSPDSVTTCSCGVDHGDGESEKPFVPCDHEDCQLCKFLCSFGWLPSPSVDVETHNSFQFLSIDDYALVKISERKSYLGRAPPAA